MDFKIFQESKAKVLVIGDVMIDQYDCGTVNRISPESPVPVFQFKNSYFRLGGAANVAANLAGIIGQVSLMSVVGDDNTGKQLLESLSNFNIDTSLVIIDSTRSTTLKTRILAQNNQQILRVDHEDTSEISRTIQIQMLDALKEKLQDISVIIISDYLKGVLPIEFTKKVINLCNANGKKVIIDVKDKNINKYKNAYLLKPNLLELNNILGRKINGKSDLIESVYLLKEKSNCSAVLVTLGEQGMILLDENNEIESIPTMTKEVYDVTGAGDTVIAFLTSSIANGLKLVDSAKIANIAAGIQVGKVGTSIVQIFELEKYYTTYESGIDKCIDAPRFNLLKSHWHDKKVVFTNGCFDILHVGHIRYLKKAAELGDILVVGLNSDNSIKRLKGNDRPVNREKDRIEMLSELDFIDYIIVFNDDTPYEVIKTIEPDILVKGGDYTLESVVGKDIVESYGGEVKIIPVVEGFSTTNIIGKILVQKG